MSLLSRRQKQPRNCFRFLGMYCIIVIERHFLRLEVKLVRNSVDDLEGNCLLSAEVVSKVYSCVLFQNCDLL